MSLFHAENLSFNSNNSEIIKNISLEIEKGTTILTGKSGSGKSTLLKLLAGILIPSDGKVFYNEQNIQKFSKKQNLEFRKKCAFVFQDSALWENQSIEQNLILPLKIHYPQMSELEINMSVQGVIAMINFEKDLSLRPAALSTGERKKIAFARAIITGPEVLFLDECLESMDKKSADLIVNLLHNFTEQGNSIICISHSSSFLKEFPGKVFHIEKGALSDEI